MGEIMEDNPAFLIMFDFAVITEPDILKDFFKDNAANGTGAIHHNATNNLCGMVAITGGKKDLLKDIYDKIKKLDPFKKEVVEEEKPDTGYKFDYD